MKKIMIDMDDVIVKEGFIAIINEFLNTNYKEEESKGYYLQSFIPSDKKEDFFNYFLTKNLYDYVKISDGAKEIIEDLTKEYEVHITTSYIYPEIKNKCGRILVDKYNFLVNNFPFVDPFNYEFISKKDNLYMDIKIDDKVDNLNNANTKILFTAYHNKDISDEELKEKGIIRANSWFDIKDMLCK